MTGQTTVKRENKTTPAKSQLFKRQRSVRFNSPFQCPFTSCQESFIREPGTKIWEHLESVHKFGPFKFNCEQCGLRFHSEIKLKNHLEKRDSHPVNQCKFCKRYLGDEKTLEEHITSKHALERRAKFYESCGICNKQILWLRIEAHLSMHVHQTNGGLVMGRRKSRQKSMNGKYEPDTSVSSSIFGDSVSESGEEPDMEIEDMELMSTNGGHENEFFNMSPASTNQSEPYAGRGPTDQAIANETIPTFPPESPTYTQAESSKPQFPVNTVIKNGFPSHEILTDMNPRYHYVYELSLQNCRSFMKEGEVHLEWVLDYPPSESSTPAWIATRRYNYTNYRETIMRYNNARR